MNFKNMRNKLFKTGTSKSTQISDAAHEAKNTKEVLKKLPKLYEQDGKGDEALAFVKFFTPDGGWTWYATEGEPIKDEKGNEIDFEFFGLVKGFESELGYFRLSELQKIRGQLGLPVERDMFFKPTPLRELNK